jgi:hypothetical protein
MNKTSLLIFLLLLVPLQLTQPSCSRLTSDDNGQAGRFSDWDTSFRVDKAVFPDAAVLARSVVAKGNNHRLWTFLNKLSSGGTVRMGFIGGSITAGAGASSARYDYASVFCSIVGNLYPQSHIEQINAGIGGTNSRFGCSRVTDDLLLQSPDLIVIEFAVNDDPKDSLGTVESMEGLVRQCLQNPDVPVMMLFLMNKSGDTVDQSFHSFVGNHYGIPMISYRNVCWPLVENGDLALDSIFSDAIHPGNSGHLICAYLLFSFLRLTILENSVAPSLSVPSPLVSDIYQFAGIIKNHDTVATVLTTGGWRDTVRELGRMGFYSLKSRDSLTISSRARELTLGYHCSKDHSARVEVVLDESSVDTVSNFFADDWGGGKMSLKKIYLDTAMSKNHVLRFTNLDNDQFVIDYLLYSR